MNLSVQWLKLLEQLQKSIIKLMLCEFQKKKTNIKKNIYETLESRGSSFQNLVVMRIKSYFGL